MNFYSRYPAHYQTKTLHLSMEQDGAYSRLLDWYYANERPIPHDQRYAIARAMTPSEKRSTDAVLREFFARNDDVWTQYRADAEIAKARPKIDAAKENGKKGGRPPKKPVESGGKPPDDGTQGGTDEKPNGFSRGSGLGNPAGTQDEPTPKAPQSPISSSTPEGLLSAERSQSARAEQRPSPTPETAACTAMIAAGLPPTRVNASHPVLAAGIAAGATAEDYRNTATEALGHSPAKDFAWVIATVRGRLSDAAAHASNPTTNGASHAATPRRTESLADRSEREAAEFRQRWASGGGGPAGDANGEGRAGEGPIDVEWSPV